MNAFDTAESLCAAATSMVARCRLELARDISHKRPLMETIKDLRQSASDLKLAAEIILGEIVKP